jgi:hypothetical protein
MCVDISVCDMDPSAFEAGHVYVWDVQARHAR